MDSDGSVLMLFATGSPVGKREAPPAKSAAEPSSVLNGKILFAEFQAGLTVALFQADNEDAFPGSRNGDGRVR